MKFFKSLLEADKEKEEKEKKIVFIETDPREPFPADTVSALRKEINKNAKDLEKQWKSPVELVDYVFSELEVPKPLAHLSKRWDQYNELLRVAIRSLRDSRGMKGGWTTTI